MLKNHHSRTNLLLKENLELQTKIDFRENIPVAPEL